MSISPVRRWGLYSRKLEFLTSSLKSVFIISSGRGDAQELREESLICRKEEIFPHIFLPCPPIPLSCHHTASLALSQRLPHPRPWVDQGSEPGCLDQCHQLPPPAPPHITPASGALSSWCRDAAEPRPASILDEGFRRQRPILDQSLCFIGSTKLLSWGLPASQRSIPKPRRVLAPLKADGH